VEELYRLHAPVVFGFLLGLTRDRHQAEDLMQETFVQATRALGGYRGGSPRAWLLAIARSTFLDAVRKRTETPVSELPEQGTNDPDVVQRVTVQAVMARLSEPHRTAACWCSATSWVCPMPTSPTRSAGASVPPRS
jgi:RNA polymerase sigma factor (sigma-70 family)